MKNYKDFSKICLGASDGAALSLISYSDDKQYLFFGEDGTYKAYFVDKEIELPSHYKKVYEATDFVSILDDDNDKVVVYGSNIEIYRAGERGCLIYAPNGTYERN